MNTIVFIALVLTVIALSQQQNADEEAHKKQMHEDIDACVKESGVDPELPEKAMKEAQFPDDKNLKCFFKCLYQKCGRMDSNGNLNMTVVLNQVPPSTDQAKVTAAAEKCQSSKGADACETAFLAEKCIHEAVGPMPDHGH